jgi:hypothetical protein
MYTAVLTQNAEGKRGRGAEESPRTENSKFEIRNSKSE